MIEWNLSSSTVEDPKVGASLENGLAWNRRILLSNKVFGRSPLRIAATFAKVESFLRFFVKGGIIRRMRASRPINGIEEAFRLRPGSGSFR